MIHTHIKYPNLFYCIGGIIILFGYVVFGLLTKYVENRLNRLGKIEEAENAGVTEENKKMHSFSEYTNAKISLWKIISEPFSRFYWALILAYGIIAFYAYHHPYENSKTGETIRRERTTITTTTTLDTLKVLEELNGHNK